MNNKFLLLLIPVALIGGYIIGEHQNRQVITRSDKELDKDISFHKFHISKLHDTLRMKDETISYWIKKATHTDSLLKLRPQHEQVIITRFTGAPVFKLDSFLIARYPDSATVARRSNR